MTKRPDYYDMMKRPTDGATWDRLEERYGKFETQSTFKKPYQDDEYPEMEFFYPTVPYLPYPSWPYGEEEYPDYAKGGPCGPCAIICYGTFGNECSDEIYGWCHSAISCFTGDVAYSWTQKHWEVTGDPILRIEHYKTAICTHLVRKGGYCIKIFPKWDDIEPIDDKKTAKYKINFFDVWDEEKKTYLNRCEGKLEISCKEECCPAETTFTYDADNPETIVRETTETLTITGGCGPYTWSVAGTGFSLAYSNTEDRQNDLIADDTACGAATITVTDDCSTTITGYVRCTTGGWTEKSTGVCEMSGSGTQTGSGANVVYYELIADNKKQLQTTYKPGSCNCGGLCPTTCANCPNVTCDGLFDTYCSGDPGTNCIDPDRDIPYNCVNVAGPTANWECLCVTGLIYYEWECA